LRTGSHRRLKPQPTVQLIQTIRGADVQSIGPQVDNQVLKTDVAIVVSEERQDRLIVVRLSSDCRNDDAQRQQ